MTTDLSPPSWQTKGMDSREMERWEGAIGEQALLTDSAAWGQQLLWIRNCGKGRGDDDSCMSLPSEGLGLEQHSIAEDKMRGLKNPR